jgi:transcriptional regulator with XRE-family HTH domain
MPTEQDTHSWGRELRHRRRLRGLTQEQLAEAAGLSRVHISGIENGPHVQPEPETVEALVAALDWPELPAAIEESERRQRAHFNARFLPKSQPDSNYRSLYEYGVAGDPLNQDDAPPVADRIPIPPGAPEEIRRNPDSFAVRVRGTSMEGEKIADGAIVWCLPARDVRVAQGDAVVAWIINERDDLRGNVVKQYLRAAGPEGRDCLGSVYKDGKRESVFCDEFRVVGVVKAIQPPTIIPAPSRPPQREPYRNSTPAPA